MLRILLALAALTPAAVAFAQTDSVVGAWTLASYATENIQTKERQTPFGARPNGRMILTADRMIVVMTAEGRAAPKSPEDLATSFRGMVAYSGTYRTEGNRSFVTVDVAWNEGWVGMEQTRTFKLEGDKLTVETEPLQTAAGTFVAFLEFTRAK